MRYECPQCKSMRKPRTINYFPPVTVQCIACGKEAIERKFINEEDSYYKPILHVQ